MLLRNAFTMESIKFFSAGTLVVSSLCSVAAAAALAAAPSGAAGGSFRTEAGTVVSGGGGAREVGEGVSVPESLVESARGSFETDPGTVRIAGSSVGARVRTWKYLTGSLMRV